MTFVRATLALALLAIAVAAPAGALVLAPSSCGGEAPVTTSCSLGRRVFANPVNTFTMDGYRMTGTLEMVGEHDLGQVVFRCHYRDGRSACESEGSWPVPGMTYDIACRTYDYRTLTLGGSGPWWCATSDPLRVG